MISTSLRTSVVLIVFNRPETTARVFEQIAAQRPETLFVIQDAPRSSHPEDVVGCAAVRELFVSLDWPCELHTLYGKENLGPKLCISQGLDWVFSQVEEAIILEHDCLPDPTFFRFCEELLERYRQDEGVMMVCGTNFQFGRNITLHSYYFSLYPQIWGWATWRRAWQLNDVEMRRWPDVREDGLLADLFQEKKAIRYWTRRFDATYSGKLDTWDYPWTLSCWLNGGSAIVPAVNLVSNIGFGSKALNTTGSRSPYSAMPILPIAFPLIHPTELTRFAVADDYLQHSLLLDRPLAPIKKFVKQRWIRISNHFNRLMRRQ